MKRGFSWPDTVDLGRAVRRLDGVAAMANAPAGMTLTGRGGPAQIPMRIVSGNFFDVLGVQPALGRMLTTGDDVPKSQAISHDYFETMEIPIVEGRGIRDSDREGQAAVAVVSASFVKRFWPDGRALGRRVKFPLPGSPRTIASGSPSWAWLATRSIANCVAAVSISTSARRSARIPCTSSWCAPRLAMGATAKQVIGTVMSESVPVVALGVTAGVAAALLIGRFIEPLLFDVPPSDPLRVATAGVTVAVIAMLGAFAAARSAARIERLVALRND